MASSSRRFGNGAEFAAVFGCRTQWAFDVRYPLDSGGIADILQPLHTKIESTVRYLGIEVDDALSIAEQVDL